MDILTFPGYITRHIPMLIRQKMIKPEFDKTEHARQNLKYHTLIRQSLIRQKLIRTRMLDRGSKMLSSNPISSPCGGLMGLRPMLLPNLTQSNEVR